MHSLLARRGPLLGFVTGATVLLTASTAFACTTTAGKITINGKNVTNSPTSATYQGNGGDEQTLNTNGTPNGGYCTPPTRLPLANTAQTLDFTLTVSVGGCVAAATLPIGDYQVRWVKSTQAVILDGTGPKCHQDLVDPSINDPKLRSWIPLGTINVNASTPTTKSFSLATGVSRGPGNICLGQNAGSNFVAPVVFINWTI